MTYNHHEGATALESYALFRCVQSVRRYAASVKARVNFTDCYPAINDRVCEIVLFCFLIKHNAHFAQVHNLLSAYVNNALACLKP